MNKILKTMALLAVPATVAVSCKDDGMDVKFTDKGPEMTIESCATEAFMGDSVRFSIKLNDEFPLSTLKAKLLFDGTSVSDLTIRTKTYGTYDAAIFVPLLKDIPNGTAEITFTAQNTGLGITEETVEVNVNRPAPSTLTLLTGGKEYTMTKSGDFSYEVTDAFPAEASALIKCVPAAGQPAIWLGWDGTALKPVPAESSSTIPFTAVKSGTYKITADLMSLSASPFGSITSSLSESANVELLNLLQGSEIKFTGIDKPDQWNLDYDFFTLNADNTVTFKAMDGLYKLTADFSGKFIKVEAMADKDNYATLDSKGAIWAIGAGIGKPGVGPSWNTDDGVWCMAQTEAGVYSITFTAGASISKTGFSFKFFCQRGWGGEFGSYTSVNDETGLFKVTSVGNIEPATDGTSLEVGKSYQFIVDANAGNSAATLSIKTVEIPVNSLDIKVNGVQASRLSATHYQIASIALNKDESIAISGVSDLASWYLDPDLFYLDGAAIKLNVVSGTFAVDLYLDYGYATLRRLAADGSEATIKDGALWMMAWGLANPVMTSQFAFNPGSAFCMAQVRPMVFQFTGTAVDEKDGTTLGGRFRYDYISAKYFGQDGWGSEKGKILGDAGSVKYTDSAAEFFDTTVGLNDNIGLKEGVQLEKGSVYVLTIDLSTTATDGVELIDFKKIK